MVSRNVKKGRKIGWKDCFFRMKRKKLVKIDKNINKTIHKLSKNVKSM